MIINYNKKHQHFKSNFKIEKMVKCTMLNSREKEERGGGATTTICNHHYTTSRQASSFTATMGSEKSNFVIFPNVGFEILLVYIFLRIT